MDQETHENKAIIGSLSEANQGNSGDSSNSGIRVVLENPVVLNGETIDSGESWDFDAKIDGLGSTKRVADQEANDGRGIDKSLDEGTSDNSNNFVNEVILEKMIMINSGEIVSICRENRDLGITIDELGLAGEVMDLEGFIKRSNGEALGKVVQEIGRDSGISVDGVVLETVILVNSEEDATLGRGTEQFEIKDCESRPNKVTVDKSKTEVSKGEKQSCVIDMRCGGGQGNPKDGDGEMVCRICHLGSEGLVESTATTPSTDLIQLGCECKDELGIAHAYCAKEWFKVKGNRTCEICGETAKNITVSVADNRFMEERNQRRFIGNSSGISARRGGCWRGQPCCNFLMACLIIAFVLPWFFRVNMF